jgi:hypothetical protein
MTGATAAETTYAAIDTARDPALYDLVVGASDQACLFGGKISEPLSRAAPYLVHLKQGEPLLRAWQDFGRGRSWGIICRSSLSLARLRQHLKHFLTAKLPDGRVALFRFYDPRVFGPYLSTCNADELAGWFNGVSAYLVEDAAVGGFRELTVQDGRLYDAMSP